MEYLSLEILRSYEPGYIEGRQQYKGSIKYKTSNGNIEVRVGPETSTRILAIIADELVKESKEMATNLTAEVLTQAALPAPVDA